MAHPKLRPRHYADRIAQLEKLEDLQAELERVPEEWRDLVKTHLRILFERKRFERERANRHRG